jgi:hypothetical protein
MDTSKLVVGQKVWDWISGRRRGYIEVATDYYEMQKIELTRGDLRRIGEFTRENIFYWLYIYTTECLVEWTAVDFHAVCGDKEIPWATKESRRPWNALVPGGEKGPAV